MPQVPIEGFESLERRLKLVGEDAAFIAVSDRSERASSPEERESEGDIGRFELTPEQARRYLAAEAGSAPRPARALPEPDEDLDDGLGGMGLGLRSPPPRILGVAPLASADILDIALRWVRDTVESAALGETGPRTYRVRVMAPKGVKCLLRGTLSVTPPPTAPSPEPARLASQTLPEPTFEDIANDAVARSYHNLAGNWSQFGATLLRSTDKIVATVHGLVAILDGRLDKAEGRNGELLAALLEHRFAAFQAGKEVDEESAERRSREETLKQGISAIERIGSLMVTSHAGLPPQLTPLLPLMHKLAAHPPLMAALTDPKVQALLDRPEEVEQLAQLLTMAAAAGPPEADATPAADAPPVAPVSEPTPGPDATNPPSAPVAA